MGLLLADEGILHRDAPARRTHDKCPADLLGVRPELLVLATGTGSLILSHVNDPGFWMIQSFFKLEIKETLSTWTVMETVLSIAGLGGTLLLAVVLR